MKKECLLEKTKTVDDIVCNIKKEEEWLRSHNFNPDAWEIVKFVNTAPEDESILVGDFVLFRLEEHRSGFLRVSCIKNNRLFFNQVKENRRVLSTPYGKVKVVLRTKRDGFPDYKGEVFFRGIKMGPLIKLGDEPLETWKERCPFCSTKKHLTFTGGEASGSRDFIYVNFCERCRILIYFDYDIEDGPIVKKGYRRMISRQGILNSTHEFLSLDEFCGRECPGFCPLRQGQRNL